MNRSIRYRKMTIDDVERVYEIERLSFTLPWTKEAFYYEMNDNEHAHYVIAETDEEIVGYCGMWLVLDEAHVTNIAIHPDYRGKKMGGGLMQAAIDAAKENGAVLMTLEARVSNTVAQNLYRKLGFKNGGIRKRYYTDNYEDAIVMWVNFDE
ncbi:ribosomal protein S18-alanine N-acetyltransferase [Planococcus versutus]|uniref:[Ribosomal protein bS18]-alanine N-acetyltransferase n=1 Tax=Planococcus versutus TaxID=1302659 RepID=A0A1B1RZQ1_9BACL|nr:ribosomal protein S18-alanine N-acetyltransferase [Planococcus versutus]ANU26406.1 ribosomal-protein-alanine N-acetyltransferase [Planococcus versutus]